MSYVGAFCGKVFLWGFVAKEFIQSIRPSIHPSVHPSIHETLLHYLLNARFIFQLGPALFEGIWVARLLIPTLNMNQRPGGKASWILSLFLMIMVQSVWPEWWKCQPAYLSGTAWRWGGWACQEDNKNLFWNKEGCSSRSCWLVIAVSVCCRGCVCVCVLRKNHTSVWVFNVGICVWMSAHERNAHTHVYGFMVFMPEYVLRWGRRCSRRGTGAFLPRETSIVGLAFLKLITADQEITFSTGGLIKLKHVIKMHLFSSV